MTMTDLLHSSLEEGGEVGGRRRGVPAQQRALRVLGGELLGHAHVGQQHELLHHGIRVYYFLRLHFYGIVGFGVHLKKERGLYGPMASIMAVTPHPDWLCAMCYRQQFLQFK